MTFYLCCHVVWKWYFSDKYFTALTQKCSVKLNFQIFQNLNTNVISACFPLRQPKPPVRDKIDTSDSRERGSALVSSSPAFRLSLVLRRISPQVTTHSPTVRQSNWTRGWNPVCTVWPPKPIFPGKLSSYSKWNTHTTLFAANQLVSLSSSAHPWEGGYCVLCPHLGSQV